MVPTFHQTSTKHLSDQILASFVYCRMNMSNGPDILPDIGTAWGLVKQQKCWINVGTMFARSQTSLDVDQTPKIHSQTCQLSRKMRLFSRSHALHR